MKTLQRLSVHIIGSFIITSTYSQTPKIEWSKAFGGSKDEEASQILHTEDNGYLIFGKTASNIGTATNPSGNTNIFALKMNTKGEVKWQKSYGGKGEESFKQAIETEDGYIILGQTCSPNQSGLSNGYHGKGDIWIVKINLEGDIVWQNLLGGSQEDRPTEIIKTKNGGFMVLGQTFSSDGDIKVSKGSGDIWVANISYEGSLIWERSFGGTERETPVQIVVTDEEGYFILSESSSENGDVSTKKNGINIWALRISEQGTMLWQNSLGGSKTDFAKQVICNKDGSFVILGQSLSKNGDVKKAHGSYDIWVAKLNSEGEIVWQNALGGTNKEFAKQIISTQRGGYLLSAYTDSYDEDITENAGKYDIWLAKITEAGKMEWQKSLGGSNEDYPEQVITTKDGGYLMLGSTEGSDENEGLFDCWIVKLNSNGATQWERKAGGSDDDVANNLILTNDGKYIFTGYTKSKDGDLSNGYGAEDIWVFKLSLNEIKKPKLEGFMINED